MTSTVASSPRSAAIAPPSQPSLPQPPVVPHPPSAAPCPLHLPEKQPPPPPPEQLLQPPEQQPPPPPQPATPARAALAGAAAAASSDGGPRRAASPDPVQPPHTRSQAVGVNQAYLRAPNLVTEGQVRN